MKLKGEVNISFGDPNPIIGYFSFDSRDGGTQKYQCYRERPDNETAVEITYEMNGHPYRFFGVPVDTIPPDIEMVTYR